MNTRLQKRNLASRLSFVLLHVIVTCCTAQTFTVLHSFLQQEGTSPGGILVESGGTLYGTASSGGSQYGSVFRLNVDGSFFMPIHLWYIYDNLGAAPMAGLAMSGSVLFGTTTRTYQSYGDGTIFGVGTGGGFTLLKRFEYRTNGAAPSCDLVLSGANLYGTTSQGGASEYGGTVFRMDTNATAFTVLRKLEFSDGVGPAAGLVLSGTSLYGTAYGGGNYSNGTVFRIEADGSGFAVLKHFRGTDGANPTARLALGGAVLFGTTEYGGEFNKGTVFRINTDGSNFGVLHHFSGGDGAYPCAQLAGSGERLYGVARLGGSGYQGGQSGYGTLFKVNTDGSGFLLLHRFNGSNGAYPRGGMVQVGETLFGTTSGGGAADRGTVFRLDLPLAPVLVEPPLNQVAVAGTDASFSVSALGVAPLQYQWLNRAGSSIPGATRSALLLTNVQFSDAGPYRIAVGNGFGAVTSAPGFLRVISPGTVTNCAEADLRANMALGGTVRIACDGTFNLGSTITISTNTTLDATGRQVTISGCNACRVFCVRTNVNFTAIGLTIANGLATNGAAVFNDGGTLILDGVQVRDHVGTNWFEGAYNVGQLDGGAIYSRAGKLQATNCCFIGNRACPGRLCSARGGAVFIQNGEADFHLCQFLSNCVVAAGWLYQIPATNALEGSGGALYNLGVLRVTQCSFEGNTAVGGEGKPADYANAPGAGEPAKGGALCTGGDAWIDRSLFASNSAVGGIGGRGYSVGFGPMNGGPGGLGGVAYGSALAVDGASVVVNSTVAGNRDAGGKGGEGGVGGYYFDGGTGQIKFFPGGPGGRGGNGIGSVFVGNSTSRLASCTVAFNVSAGGAGGEPGLPFPSGSFGPGVPGAALNLPQGILRNTLLAYNSPSNILGTLTDAGHNLSSDDSAGLTNAASLKNTDPKLGPLANNGGPTLTMALLPSSPAIDAGNTAAAPVTDQRGGSRPYGQAADIGAFEYWLTAQAVLSPNGGVDVFALGIAGQTCCLLVSADMTIWTATATNQVGADGMALFHEAVSNVSPRFYRLMLR